MTTTTWAVARQGGQPPADLDRRLAADAGVDLVEDEGRHRVGAGEHDLDREHHPRQLAAGGALLQRPRRRTGVRAQQHLDVVDAVPGVGHGPAADGEPVGSTSVCATPTSTAALAIARAASSAETGRRTAGPHRCGPPDSSPAARASSATRSSRRARQRPIRSSSPSRAVSRAAACSAQASTARLVGSRVGLVAVLADQRDSAARRSCTTASRAGSVSTRGGVRREVGAEVGEQVAQLAQPRDQIGQPGVLDADLLERRARAGDQGRSRPAPARRRRRSRRAVRPGRWRSQRAARRRGRGAPPRPRRLVVLPRLRVDGLDLVEAEPQQVGLLGALAGLAGELVELGDDGAQLVVRRAVGVQRLGHRGTGVAVERVALVSRLQQPGLVGLAVHRHAGVGELGEHAGRHAAPAEVRAGPALGRHGADDDEHVVVELGPGLLGAGCHRALRVDPQPALDGGSLRRRGGPRRGRPGRRRAGPGRSRPSSCRLRSRRRPRSGPGRARARRRR